ncbi:MarR family winged helix-turn-helix transcriptional regulator [Lacticaseibacillus jixianensis]|uniref:MarR family winged helix-turn-helix transcriptional regulator n=1 Tax=Lacticaseibacillus jixianensis TaxID=2486012 RepID=A0ABW4BCI1_9LACO|nr:MarR family transcriptional regulator [Lacticaseibacillus jixianensis]
MNTAYLLLEAAKRLKHQLNLALSQHNTTAQQWAILEALTRLEGTEEPVTAARLAAAIDSDRQTTAAVVLRLAKKGWLERTRLKADKRAVALTLSPTGRKQVTALQQVASATLTAFLATLPPAQQQQLAQALTKLVEANS